jgi:hypothetical protein
MGRYVGQVEDIIKDYDVFTHDGFEHVMREAQHVPEGELYHLAAYSPSGGYDKSFQNTPARPIRDHLDHDGPEAARRWNRRPAAVAACQS